MIEPATTSAYPQPVTACHVLSSPGRPGACAGRAPRPSLVSVETRVPAVVIRRLASVPQHGRVHSSIRVRGGCHHVTPNPCRMDNQPGGEIVADAATRPAPLRPQHTGAPLAGNVVAKFRRKGTPHMPQELTVSAHHADEANDLYHEWTRLAVQYGLTRKEDVECVLMRQNILAHSLNQKAVEELAIVTGLRRGLTSPSSRRQLSAICRIDTGTG